jgi:uncharacterized protein
MFISVEQLQQHRVKFDEAFPPGQVDFRMEGLCQVEPLKVKGEASLIVNEIDVKGQLGTVMEMACARCLEPTRHMVDVKFDLSYRPLGTIARAEEFQVPVDEVDIGFYHGAGLQLEDVVKEQVLLALPMKIICKADCRGLCVHCGKNLNRESCDCHEQPVDPRWDGLIR